MATSIKRRVTRVGPKHRLWITLEQDTFEALQASGEKEGFSISALAQRVIIRGVAAGLINDLSPTSTEEYYRLTEERCRLYEELCRLYKEQIEIGKDRLDLKDRMIALQQRGLEEQGAEIKAYEKRASLEAAGPVEHAAAAATQLD